MKKVFWGFFFVYLNFNLTLNGHALNLLPDFVGYILLFQAAGALAGESGRFRTLRPFAAGMAVYTGILWVRPCWPSPAAAAGLDGLLSLAAAGGVPVHLLERGPGCFEIERVRGADLNGQSLRTAWFILLAARSPVHRGAPDLRRAGAGGGAGRPGGHHLFLAALWKCAGGMRLCRPGALDRSCCEDLTEKRTVMRKYCPSPDRGDGTGYGMPGAPHIHEGQIEAFEALRTLTSSPLTGTSVRSERTTASQMLLYLDREDLFVLL